MPVELSVEQQTIAQAAKILRGFEDGKELRKGLLKAMRDTMEPVTQEIQSNLMAMGGSFGDTPSLRSEVARQLKVESRASGRNTGVRIRVKRTQGVREFANAPKRINSRTGWRRRVFGTDVWVHQTGAPGFFDDPIRDRREEAKQAVMAEVRALAQIIADRVSAAG